MGITWCPGCGLGHAISFLFHGDLKSSFHAHWLGVPAVIIIGYRIFSLARMRLYSQPLLPRFSQESEGELSEIKK
jgi:hypothetical protein